MAIQLRRGAYADFDPQKMKPAEVAVVQEDDPTSHDGKAVYVAISPGDVKRIAVLDELQDAVYNQIDTAISTATQEAVTTATQAAAESAADAAESAEQAAESARTLTIDSTLTQPGQAADAKATGKKINAVREIINSEFYTSTTQESGQFVKINGIGQKCKINSEDDDLILTHIGKNILPFPYFRSGSVTSNGITFTINDDGSIRVYGVATSNVTYQITQETPASSRKPIKKGTYTLSGTPKTGFTGTARMFLSGIGQGTLYDYGDGKSFTVDADTTYYLKIYVAEGTEIDAVFYPQIEFGGKKTKWERYKEETITLVDGNAETTLFDGINAFLASADFSLEYNIPETINLKSIGAVGDGIADDTFAINRALKMAEGKTLLVPEGTYLFSETLEIHSGTRIVGCGAKSKFLLADNFTLTPYAWRTGDPLVEDPYRYPMICFDDDAQGCILENLAIQGQSATFYDKNCDGLTIRGNNHIVKNLHVTKINYFPSNFIGRVNNGVGYGIKVQSAANVMIENCYVEECGYECIGLEDAKDVKILGCICKKACQTAAQIHRDCVHIRVCNSTFNNENYMNTGTSGPGFTVHASVEHPMEDILIEGNYINSAFVFANGGAENRVRIVNNQMKGISLNAIDGYREGCFVIGNRVNGQLNVRSDNVVVGGNMVYHTGGGYMIRIYGNNVETFANIALGDARGVLIQPHDN